MFSSQFVWKWNAVCPYTHLLASIHLYILPTTQTLLLFVLFLIDIEQMFSMFSSCPTIYFFLQSHQKTPPSGAAHARLSHFRTHCDPWSWWSRCTLWVCDKTGTIKVHGAISVLVQWFISKSKNRSLTGILSQNSFDKQSGVGKQMHWAKKSSETQTAQVPVKQKCTNLWETLSYNNSLLTYIISEENVTFSVVNWENSSLLKLGNWFFSRGIFFWFCFP